MQEYERVQFPGYIGGERTLLLCLLDLYHQRQLRLSPNSQTNWGFIMNWFVLRWLRTYHTTPPLSWFGTDIASEICTSASKLIV